VRRLALTLAVLLPSSGAAALDKPLGQCTVEVWRAKDGLPSDSVRALAQTADGRLWAATLGGVVRFDGRQWSAPAVPARTRSLLSDVTQVHAGSDGVWLLPPRRGLLRLGPDGARTFDAADGWAGEARGWAERGRQIWIASADHLFRYADGRFVPLPISGLAGAPTALEVDPAGALWVGSNRGLSSLENGRLVPVPALAEQPVAALHRDRAGTLWAAAGAHLVALPSGKSYGAADGLPAAIAALADDRDGNLWIGTAEGLVRLHDGRFTVFTTRDGLPDDDVTSVLVDREETLWVGTRRGGLAQFTDRTLQTLPALEGVVLDSVCEADDGALWFGTRRRGVARWKDGQLTFFGTRDGLPSETVYAVLPDGGDAVWIGTVRGLVRYQAGKIQPLRAWDRVVTGLYRDRSGALWIAGNGELGRLAGSLTVFRPAQGLPAGQLRAVAEDGRGTVWVSAIGGLVRLENDRFVPGPAELDGVRSMLASRDGSFWLTTVNKGLARLADGDLRLFPAPGGVEPERLSQLLEDDAEKLWIGVHNKIVRVDRASLEAMAQGRRTGVRILAFESTDRRAGVVTEQVRQPSAWKARDGRLWFITNQGAVVIDPRAVRVNAVPPVVEIDAATMDGRAAPLDGEAHFSAGPGHLVLQFAAISLLQPGRIRYRYRLEGLDPDWIDAGPARTATYAGLRPGRYRFAVQASNNDGLWNERGASFPFVLAAPFYRRTWFFAVCGLTGLGLAIAGYRVRVARLRAEYVLLFAERNRMARELHDTLLQGLSATALQLSGIRAEGRALPPSTQKDLALMQETISQCLQETRQAVWGLRERGSGQPGELGASLERMLQRLCGARGVQGTFRGEGTPAPLPHPLEDELFRIAQEAVSNALQHAGARAIEVRLCYDAATVTLAISDDGGGFDAAAPPPQGHFGLTGMRERAARLDATLEVTSGPGTVVTVRVSRS
jgi:signal transduction histidine kinase/ligand-binding sensor domain-containing protein